jgi:hypothetical protein
VERPSLIAVCGLLLFSVGAAVFAQQSPVPSSPPRPPTVRVMLDWPPTPEGIRLAIGRLSVTQRTPVGVELVTEALSKSPRDRATAVTRPSDFASDLTGLSVGEALSKIANLRVSGPVSTYQTVLDGGIIHFRPAAFQNNREVALNRVIEHVSPRPRELSRR